MIFIIHKKKNRNKKDNINKLHRSLISKNRKNLTKK